MFLILLKYLLQFKNQKILNNNRKLKWRVKKIIAKIKNKNKVEATGNKVEATGQLLHQEDWQQLQSEQLEPGFTIAAAKKLQRMNRILLIKYTQIVIKHLPDQEQKKNLKLFKRIPDLKILRIIQTMKILILIKMEKRRFNNK